jgi:hypothetical protein
MRFFSGLAALLASSPAWLAGQTPASPPVSVQKFTYKIEWRFIHAGQATVESRGNWAQLKLESAGLVSKLYRVNTTYSVNYDDPFCATSSLMDAKEGKRHRETRVTYDREQKYAYYTERDLLKDAVIRTADVAVPGCVHDVVGALARLRRIALEPGTTIELPVSDGRRSAAVKIEAQEREDVKTPAGRFKAIRFEAGLMNGVVYGRKGRVFVWMSDDERRLPVQIRLRTTFPVGTITLALEKEESL